jgi:hypothetical protein
VLEGALADFFDVAVLARMGSDRKLHATAEDIPPACSRCKETVAPSEFSELM